jgi:hypothetical protein
MECLLIKAGSSLKLGVFFSLLLYFPYIGGFSLHVRKDGVLLKRVVARLAEDPIEKKYTWIYTFRA